MYIVGGAADELGTALTEATRQNLIEWRAADFYDGLPTLAGLTVFVIGLVMGGHNFGNIALIILADGLPYLIFDGRLMMALGPDAALPDAVRNQVARQQWTALVTTTEENAKKLGCNAKLTVEGIHKILAHLEAAEPVAG